MALLLYAATAGLVLAVWKRFVQDLSILAMIGIALIPLVFTGGAMFTGRVYAPIDLPFATEPLRDYAADFGASVPAENGTLSDLYTQMIPWQSAVREQWLRGEWPLWNPHMLSGTVLAANMQSAPFDPFQAVALLLDHPDALTFGATITFFLGVLFMFAFARSLGCGEVPSLIGATGYAFCGMLAFFVQWPLGRIWTYAPLVFLAVRMVVRETNVRAAVLLTSAFVLTIVTGHPESLLHIVTCGAAWGVFELLGQPRERRLRAAALATLCGVVALLLTAIALLPFFEAANATAEFAYRHHYYAKEPLHVEDGAVARRAAGSAFPIVGGPGQWVPVAKNWDPTTIRMGSLVLLLALLAIVFVRRREARFFAVFGLLTALAGLNAWPLAQILHALPGFNVALNERLVFAAALALSILAAMAAEEWPKTRRGALAAAALAGAACLALAGGSALLRPAQLAAGVRPETITRLLLADLVPAALLALLLAFRAPRRIALPAVLALLLLQRQVEDGGTYPALDRRMFYPEIPILRQVQNDPARPFRIAPIQYALVPAAAALYGLEDVRGYEAMTLRKYYELYPLWCEFQPPWFNAVADWRRPFLSFLNVRYAIASNTQQPDAQWKLVAEDRSTRLFQNTRILPRAFVPPRIEYVPEPMQAWPAMRSATDFGAVAWITAPEYPAHAIENGPGTVKVVRAEGAELLLDASMTREGWVVTSQPGWPGWRAYVDGKRVQPRDANHAFVGVYVPAGRHRVTLRFVPDSFTRGRAISALTLAGLCVFFARRRWIRRRSDAQRSATESKSQAPYASDVDSTGSTTNSGTS